MNKPLVVATLIVKNEEELLSRCLDSIKGVDFIYISDTGSKDKTVEIARKYTDKVWTDNLWQDSFCKARNYILDKVKEDFKDENVWILSIDADEFLHDFSKIPKAIEEGEKKGVLAIDCKLFSEKERQLHVYPRLFKKSPKVWWEGAVHNHISVSTGYSSEVEITYGYSPAHTKDPERSMRILKAQVEKTGNARETFYLGREYWYRAMYKECAETMEIYIPKAHFLPEKADAYLLLSRCYFCMGRGDEARTACANALIVNPHFKEACSFMARIVGKGSGNPQWEHNATQWEKMAETADNSLVLFVKTI